MGIFVIDGISTDFRLPEQEALCHAKRKLKAIGIRETEYTMNIFRKAIDARHKNDIRFVYSFSVEPSSEAIRKHLIKYGVRELKIEMPDIPHGCVKSSYSPLVVGMGPAGLFCAYTLAKNGYKPIIIDRGDSVFDRAECVNNFFSHAILDSDSNIQFGAGGAGTFSDGKLLTRINDPLCSFVLDTLCHFGAPEDIRIKAKPHVGTDNLRLVVDNMLRSISDLGGKVIYRCKLESLTENSDGSVTAHTSKGDILSSLVVLALGHSARDTYRMLIENGYDIIAKPISVGVRIEHKRSDIEKAMFGKFAGHPLLGAAEYSLSDTRGERGVYTFCMCPGGEVIAAASEQGGVVVNGMSHYARDGENSNSAIAVSVSCDKYVPVDGSLALGAIEFQRNIEKAAFIAAGSNYNVPVQTVGDFLNYRHGTEPTYVKSTYMGKNRFTVCNLEEVLPSFVCESLRYGIFSFERKMPGFCDSRALLSAPETRTSSPLRILRNENMVAIGRKNIYPCGEGAGYAGGITSASVDGLKVAMAIMSRFAPVE